MGQDEDLAQAQGPFVRLLSQALRGQVAPRATLLPVIVFFFFQLITRPNPKWTQKRSWHVLHDTSCQKVVRSSEELSQAGPDKASFLYHTAVHQP